MSSHSSLKEKSIKSVRGMVHMIAPGETVLPGVAQVMMPLGVTVEMDAPFQVYIIVS